MPDNVETIDIIESWLYATLSGDSVLMDAIGGPDSLSGTLAVDVMTPPYVAWLLQSHRDITGNAGQIISADCLYEVKAVAQSGSWDDVRPLAGRIQDLLHRPYEVVNRPDGSLTCVRERIIQYPEVDGGQQYRHLGGIYRVRASSDV